MMSNDVQQQMKDDYLEKVKELAKEKGYAVQGVFALEDHEANFAYTVGLSGSKDITIIFDGVEYVGGFEIITICTNISVNTLGWIVDGLVMGLKDKKIIDIDKDELPSFAYMKDGEDNKIDLRMKLISVPKDMLVDSFKIRLDPNFVVKHGFQLLIADANNRLPGEEGYDKEKFNQDISQLSYT